MHPIVKLIVDVLMFVRPIWVAPIVLPLSWIARWIEIIQGGTFEISPKDHRARVEKLAADVRTAKANGALLSNLRFEPLVADICCFACRCHATLLGPQP